MAKEDTTDYVRIRGLIAALNDELEKRPTREQAIKAMSFYAMHYVDPSCNAWISKDTALDEAMMPAPAEPPPWPQVGDEIFEVRTFNSGNWSLNRWTARGAQALDTYRAGLGTTYFRTAEEALKKAREQTR